VAEDAQGKFRHAASNLSHALADREYLLGAFSSADIVVGSVLMWAASMGLLTDFPALDAYLNRLKARPAWKRSVAD
jgi:glutathione S-transferase